jgi:hypothetical protein
LFFRYIARRIASGAMPYFIIYVVEIKVQDVVSGRITVRIVLAVVTGMDEIGPYRFRAANRYNCHVAGQRVVVPADPVHIGVKVFPAKTI